MVHFEYYTPTRVVFGPDAEDKTGELIKALNAKKVLLHYGGGSALVSGLMDKVCDSLDRSGIEYLALGGVVPNPRLSLVREGISLCKKEGIDFILAIGGGSVIDSAKAIAYGACVDFDVWDFYSRKAQATKCLHIGCVLTIAAAGSEMSWSSVITNEATGEKRGYSNDLCRCQFAMMNPKWTLSTPAYSTACGCVDILMHTMERYFGSGESLELTDEISEALMRTVIRAARAVHANPKDEIARAELMWASSLSHNGLMDGGRRGDWSCHQLEHELSGRFDVAHGAGLAAIWSAWARYVCQNDLSRFARFAIQVMDVEPHDMDIPEIVAEGILNMESFFESIGMPTSLTALGIEVTENLFDELADDCSFQGTRTIGSFRQLTKEDMSTIYRLAW